MVDNIRPYQAQEQASGFIQSQANGDDFGAQTGQAMEKFGQQVSDSLHQYNVEKDTTNIHVHMAQQQAAWAQELDNRYNNAQPGQQDFAAGVMQDMSKSFADGQDLARTREGRQLYARMASEMTSQFGVKAVGMQSNLDAEGARNQYKTLSDSLGSTAFLAAKSNPDILKNPADVEALVQQGVSAINDKNTIFGRVPQGTRDELTRNLQQDIREGAMRGVAAFHPENLLAQMSPETLAQFRPTTKVLAAEGLLPKADFKSALDTFVNLGGTAAPFSGAAASPGQGGAPSVDQAKAWWTGIKADQLPQSTALAGLQAARMVGVDEANKLIEKTGGDPNLMLGQLRQIAAAQGNMPAIVQQITALQGALDKAPQVTPDKLDSVYAAQAQSSASVKTGNSIFDGLPWQKQYEIVAHATQSTRMDVARDLQMKQMALQQLEEARQQQMNSYLNDFIDGKLRIDTIRNDTLLSFGQRDLWVNMLHSQADQGSAIKTDPGTYTSLMNRIHLPDGDPQKITNPDQLMPYFGKGLDYAALSHLRDEVNGKKDGEAALKAKFFGMGRQQITKSTPLQPDAAGDEMAYNWEMYANKVYDQERAAGTPMHDLLDPASPKYLGKTIAPFVRSTQEAINDKLKSGTGSYAPKAQPASPANPLPAAAGRLPGESAAAWVARTHGASK